MRQIVYISTASPTLQPADPAAILSVSRSNNAADGIAGLLYFNGRRFLQALEGDAAIVQRTFDRIAADPRHRAIVTLSDRTIDAREFGDWAMAYRARFETDDQVRTMLAMLAARADPSIRATFAGLAGLSRAA